MPLSADLFPIVLPDGFFFLKGAVSKEAQRRLVKAVRQVIKKAPFMHAKTRSGLRYSAKMTNCGQLGWWNYRYTTSQPGGSDNPWPPMPTDFKRTLTSILEGTGLENFLPDCCLINHYVKGAKMGLHQDKDEVDFNEPIVTICLGAAADFLIGGLDRSERPKVIGVQSGDVVIMAGPSRLRFHGIRKIHSGTSPLKHLPGRLSLTFRRAS